MTINKRYDLFNSANHHFFSIKSVLDLKLEELI